MKNIHILPTDKQSVLYKLNKFDDEFFLKRDLKNVLNPLYLFYNIYITSYNQDINENDYIITKDGKLVQVSYLLSEDLKGASKVISTTDQKLINDDVQAIPDEFLKWFIKNPSCEEVEVKPLLSNNGRALFGYKIIIPKEEPVNHSSSVLYNLDNKIPKEEPKQETLEEVAERYYEDEVSINAFINGYKLAQEQILDFLYSEITERRDYSASKMCEKVVEFIEQFKNN